MLGLPLALANGSIVHNLLAGLTVGDPHTQYALLAGRGTDQVLNGGTTAGGNIFINSTTDVTKGTIVLGQKATIDDANGDYYGESFVFARQSTGAQVKVRNSASMSPANNYTVIWPLLQGAANSVPLNNGSGVLTWATPTTLAGVLSHSALTNLGNVADHLLYLDLAGNRPMTGTLTARQVRPTTDYAFSLGSAAARWNFLNVGRVRSVAENGVTAGVGYITVFTALGSGYYVMSGDNTNAVPMAASVGDSGTGGPATAFMGLFNFDGTNAIVQSVGTGDSCFQSGNVGIAASGTLAASATHQALGQGSHASGSCYATIVDSASILTFGTTVAATGATAIGSVNYTNLIGLKTLTLLAENVGAVVMGYVTANAVGTIISSLRATQGGAFAQAYVARGVAIANNFGSSLSGHVEATNNTAGIISSGLSSHVNAAIISTGSAVASKAAAFCNASVTGAASATASGAGSAVFGQTGAVAMTAAFTNSWQFGPGAAPEADVLAVGVAGTGIALKGTTGAFAAPLLGQIYTSGGFVRIHSNGVAVQQNVGQAYTTATFTTDRDISNSATITTVELGDVLASLIADLKTANILN